MTILTGFPPTNVISTSIHIGPRDLTYPKNLSDESFVMNDWKWIKKHQLNVTVEIIEEWESES